MAIAFAIFSYLLGSIPTGYLLGRFSGIDVRKTGSGNIGATNVGRTLGKGRGLLTLIADAAKGWIPVYLAARFGLSEFAVAVVGAAAFAGHLFPLYLRFQGGKGVATAMGVMLALTPLAVLILGGVFTLALIVGRIVSLSSIAAATAAPIVVWLLGYSPPAIALVVFLAIMVVLRHRSNLQRLLAGSEPRLGSG